MIATRVRERIRSLANLVSDDTLTKKAGLNALAAALDYGARLLVGLLVTPLIVAGLGDYAYGAWRILERLVGYISPASGRPTQALKCALATQQNSTDYDEKRRAVASALAVWALFLPVVMLLGGVLVWFAPSWLHAPANLSLGIRLAATLLVADVAVGSLMDLPRSVLAGENLGYKRMGLSALLVFLSGGFMWLAVQFHAGVAGMAAATLATTVLTGALFLQVVRIHAPWYGLARPSFKAVREFLGLSGWFLGWTLVMRLMTATDVVLLGMLGSVESVATYTLTKYAPETLIGLVAIMVFGTAPGLGGVIGSGNLRRAARVRAEMMTLTWFITTVLGSMVMLWNRTFLGLWVGAEHYAGALPSLLIVAVVMQFVLIRNDANIIDLTLDLRAKVLLGFLSVALSAGAAAVLIRYAELGISGLCLGFLVGRAVLSVSYPLAVGRLLHLSLVSQFRSVLRPVLATAVLFALAMLLDRFVSISSMTAAAWVRLILSAGAATVVFAIMAFYGGLTGEQREQVLSRLRWALAVGRS